MNVTLIDYTINAVDKLLYTKATRLTQGANTRQEIAAMSKEEKAKELAYMATTIPSSWEFITYTFEITGVTRAFTHQFVRTRTGSYAQQTMRMLPMERFTYATGPTVAADAGRQRLYDHAMSVIQQAYDQLIKAGASVEDARGILPTNIKTNIIAQFSLRTLAEMNRSRGGQRTQGEYRTVLHRMKDEVMRVHPWALDFICPSSLAPIGEVEAVLAGLPIPNDTRVFLHKQLDRLRKAV